MIRAALRRLMNWRYRHRWTWDLSRVADPAHRRVLHDALNACDYPFRRIRENTGRRVPVTVSDLSRFAAAPAMPATAKAQVRAHMDVHDDDGAQGHALTGELENGRRASLGLYWLPTEANPAGRVEIDAQCFEDPDLAREVFLAEGAHAVDYGVPLTDEQRQAIFALYHGGDATPHGDHGWFEEHGGQDYWSWVGESFMSGFMAAFAPSLPRPLEEQQPWVHPTTPEIAAGIRALLR